MSIFSKFINKINSKNNSGNISQNNKIEIYNDIDKSLEKKLMKILNKITYQHKLEVDQHVKTVYQVLFKIHTNYLEIFTFLILEVKKISVLLEEIKKRDSFKDNIPFEEEVADKTNLLLNQIYYQRIELETERRSTLTKIRFIINSYKKEGKEIDSIYNFFNSCLDYFNSFCKTYEKIHNDYMGVDNSDINNNKINFNLTLSSTVNTPYYVTTKMVTLINEGENEVLLYGFEIMVKELRKNWDILNEKYYQCTLELS